MPVSAQALYFHLAMKADDDGFVQPSTIMRIIGSTQDDLRVLLAKRFLLSFESGVVVIKHWLIHNMIRADRYKPTRFIEEKKGLYLKENNAYSDNPESGKLLLATIRQPDGNHPAPQVRLGKDSIVDEAKAPSSFAEANSNAQIKSPLGTITKTPLDPQDGGERPAKGPRKPRETWAAERKVFDTFAAKVKRELGISIMAPAGWQLKHIKKTLAARPDLNIDDIFDEWFSTNRKDEELVQIHFALSGPNITRYLATNS